MPDAKTIIDPAATMKTVAEAADISIDVVDKLLDRVSGLKTIFSGVISMPGEAEKALAEILEEVEKSVVAIDDATGKFPGCD